MTISRRDILVRQAAPDLLAALKNVVDSANSDSDTCVFCRSDGTNHASGCAVTVALAAIAKAEGHR